MQMRSRPCSHLHCVAFPVISIQRSTIQSDLRRTSAILVSSHHSHFSLLSSMPWPHSCSPCATILVTITRVVKSACVPWLMVGCDMVVALGVLHMSFFTLPHCAYVSQTS